jgi:hypothetical protein
MVTLCQTRQLWRSACQDTATFAGAIFCTFAGFHERAGSTISATTCRSFLPSHHYMPPAAQETPQYSAHAQSSVCGALLSGTTSGSERGRRDHQTCARATGRAKCPRTNHMPTLLVHGRQNASGVQAPLQSANAGAVGAVETAHGGISHFLGSQRRGSATSSVRSYCSSVSLIATLDCSSTYFW